MRVSEQRRSLYLTGGKRNTRVISNETGCLALALFLVPKILYDLLVQLSIRP